ncbi:MAG: flotillin family protein [Polyangiaceae bacterium]|nr:flotillin family protein [Polyangiaceae bacterium]
MSLIIQFAIGAGGLVALYFLLGLRRIANDRVGILERRFSSKGSLSRGLIATEGEAGFVPRLLRGGVHWYAPFFYRVHRARLVTIPQGRIGYVFARDGIGLGPHQTLGKAVACDNFQDVEAFLANGGQKGPQRNILREGTYAINVAQFIVITAEKIHLLALDDDDLTLFQRMQHVIAERGGFTPVVLQGEDDLMGVVTIHDGPPLPQGELIAPIVGDNPLDQASYHNSFQDPERFLYAGGRRGRQLQVLIEGTYYLNRLFASVEPVKKTVVEVGHVGVVVSYTGETGSDLSGKEYKHGELVAPGQRGVWSVPLLPGKYAFNTYAGKVVMVPTTNFILKWNKREIGSHRFDENLTEVSLITKDAFEPSLPLSVVVHIDYRKAPLVVQRFGDVKKLVEQTLDPMVAAYFKNIGQTKTLIQLLQDRSDIQRTAGEEMRDKFGHYNLEMEEVLIGTPTSSNVDSHIDQILTQLRARQIAEEQIETYARQERAAVKERELREAEARAREQQRLTQSELGILVQANQGRAEYEVAVQKAAQIRALAEAEAERVRVMADAEAERAARIGVAEAMAIEEQVRAYGGPKLQLTQKVLTRFSEAIEKSGVDVVPRVVVGGGNGSQQGQGGLLDALLAMMLSDKTLDDATVISSESEPREVSAKMRRHLEERLGSMNGHANHRS